jgi:hypothetical protein
MSSVSFDHEMVVSLARIELLQGILREESSDRRQSLYDNFGSSGNRWIDRARSAYEAMSEIPGWTSSVGDQLLAEIDIREHAELYSAVGGLEVTEITHGRGTWWSPSATWFWYGSELIASAELIDPVGADFDEAAQLLLEAGAHSLARFFSAVVTGGLASLDSGRNGAFSRKHFKEAAFVVEVARMRGLLFRDGPDRNGRYLGRESVQTEDIVGMLKNGADGQSGERVGAHEPPSVAR